MTRALVLLLLLVTAGCGGSSGSGASSDLQITVWPRGKAGASSSYTLNCPAGTGTLPKARAACSKLRQAGASAFAPVPLGTACTEIYGGPQIALVSGKPISSDFSRTNGCEIARWERLAFLFPTGP
jgi:hypothetical protein